MENEAPAPQAPKTVLLIDDSDTVRLFLRRLFERESPRMEVIEATDGKAAMNQLTRNKADLIVSDLQMPGMDGRSFIAKLRSNAILRKKSLIVLSSEDLSDLRDLYVADAGIRFLKKPSSPQEILDAARELLSGNILSGGVS